MKKVILVSVALILIITACEKKLDIDIPEGQKHLVVNGIINPDSLIQIRLSKSQNVLDNNDIEFLSTADVKLFKDDEFVENLIHTDTGMYLSSVFPDLNSEYKLTVDYSGLNPVSAVNTLTPPVNILSVDTTISIRIEDYGEGYIDTVYEVHFQIKIRDNGNNTDYYFLGLSSLQPVYEEYNDELILTGYEEYNEWFDSNDHVFRGRKNDFSLDGIQGKVFTDELFNGNEYTVNVRTQLYNYNNFDLGKSSLTYFIKLLTVTEDIYRYITSYNLNQQTQFDPFSQPVQIYTNIENGLGLFSGYTMDVDSLIVDF